MNSLATSPKNQIRHDVAFDNPSVINTLRTAIDDALTSIEDSRQKCLIVGQMLNEVQANMEHGQFQQYITTNFPKLEFRTAQRWAKAGANILKALPVAPVDVESQVTVSQILTMPNAELTTDQRKYKQAWFDLTENKTIKECCAGVFVEGDEAHRIDRALNGKTKGGVGKQKDRKAFEKFTATKLQHITTFLTVQKKSSVTGKKQIVGWRKLSPVQQTQICAVFNSFIATAPQWLIENLADSIKGESKLSDAQRLAR